MMVRGMGWAAVLATAWALAGCGGGGGSGGANPPAGGGNPAPPPVAPSFSPVALVREQGKRIDKSTYLRYEMPDGNEHIYITKPGHPAHPAVVRRTVITRLGTEKLATRGAHGGSQQAFEKWLAEFKALDVNRPSSTGLKPIPAP